MCSSTHLCITLHVLSSIHSPIKHLVASMHHNYTKWVKKKKTHNIVMMRPAGKHYRLLEQFL